MNTVIYFKLVVSAFVLKNICSHENTKNDVRHCQEHATPTAAVTVVQSEPWEKKKESCISLTSERETIVHKIIIVLVHTGANAKSCLSVNKRPKCTEKAAFT